MRYLLIIIALLVPCYSFAVTGQDLDFRFSVGKPTLIIDADTNCGTTAVARFAFSAGSPAVIYDADATCNAAAGGYVTPVNSIIWINED
jgi:hypothetical protein